MTPGKGRLVLTADCSMWTAQLVTLNGKEFQYGMARKDLDNRQFALNTFRWLSRALKMSPRKSGRTRTKFRKL